MSRSRTHHFTRQLDGSQASLRRRGVAAASLRRCGVRASLRRCGVIAALRRRCGIAASLRQVDGSQASRVSAASNRPLKTGLVAGADFLIATRRSCARRTFVVRSWEVLFPLCAILHNRFKPKPKSSTPSVRRTNFTHTPNSQHFLSRQHLPKRRRLKVAVKTYK
jgi:hypothetical protein